jgi:hypothetical protein
MAIPFVDFCEPHLAGSYFFPMRCYCKNRVNPGHASTREYTAEFGEIGPFHRGSVE